MLNTTAHVWLERFKRVEEQSGKGEKLQGGRRSSCRAPPAAASDRVTPFFPLFHATELKQMYDSLALSPVDPIEAR